MATQLIYPPVVLSESEVLLSTLIMRNSRYKTWFIALMLLVFAGQTVSVLAMPCQMAGASMATTAHDMSEMTDPMSMDHDMAGMAHDMPMSHNTSATADKTPFVQDCCKLPGHCASGSCSSAGFAYSVDFILVTLSANVADDYLSVIPATLISSLFRPPIFR